MFVKATVPVSIKFRLEKRLTIDRRRDPEIRSISHHITFPHLPDYYVQDQKIIRNYHNFTRQTPDFTGLFVFAERHPSTVINALSPNRTVFTEF